MARKKQKSGGRANETGGGKAVPRKLSEKQRRFVEFYMGMAGGNATKAAKLAGYSAKTAHRSGAQNMQKYAIKEAIEERVEDDPTVATREDLQRFWTDMVLGQGGEQPRDQLKASELLAKSQGVFVERKESKKRIEKSLTVRFVKGKK